MSQSKSFTQPISKAPLLQIEQRLPNYHKYPLFKRYLMAPVRYASVTRPQILNNQFIPFNNPKLPLKSIRNSQISIQADNVFINSHKMSNPKLQNDMKIKINNFGMNQIQNQNSKRYSLYQQYRNQLTQNNQQKVNQNKRRANSSMTSNMINHVSMRNSQVTDWIIKKYTSQVKAITPRQSSYDPYSNSSFLRSIKFNQESGQFSNVGSQILSEEYNYPLPTQEITEIKPKIVQKTNLQFKKKIDLNNISEKNEDNPDYKLALKMGRLQLNKTPVKNEARTLYRNKKSLKMSARSMTKSPYRNSQVKEQTKEIQERARKQNVKLAEKYLGKVFKEKQTPDTTINQRISTEDFVKEIKKKTEEIKEKMETPFQKYISLRNFQSSQNKSSGGFSPFGSERKFKFQTSDRSRSITQKVSVSHLKEMRKRKGVNRTPFKHKSIRGITPSPTSRTYIPVDKTKEKKAFKFSQSKTSRETKRLPQVQLTADEKSQNLTSASKSPKQQEFVVQETTPKPETTTTKQTKKTRQQKIVQKLLKSNSKVSGNKRKVKPNTTNELGKQNQEKLVDIQIFSLDIKRASQKKYQPQEKLIKQFAKTGDQQLQLPGESVRKYSDVSAYTLKHFIQKKYTPVTTNEKNKISQKEIIKQIKQKKKFIKESIDLLDSQLLLGPNLKSLKEELQRSGQLKIVSTHHTPKNIVKEDTPFKEEEEEDEEELQIIPKTFEIKQPPAEEKNQQSLPPMPVEKEKKPKNTHERLYNDGKKRLNRKIQLQNQKKKQQKNELKECTFKPTRRHRKNSKVKKEKKKRKQQYFICVFLCTKIGFSSKDLEMATEEE